MRESARAFPRNAGRTSSEGRIRDESLGAPELVWSAAGSLVDSRLLNALRGPVPDAALGASDRWRCHLRAWLIWAISSNLEARVCGLQGGVTR